MTSTWHQVTRKAPCPICGKPDWCGRTSNGTARCMRVSEPPPGWAVIKTCPDGGTVFQCDDGQAVARGGPAQRTGKDSARGYRTLKEATAGLEKMMGSTASQWWDYRRDGEIVGRVCRFEMSGGKTFRPISLHDGVWRLKAMPAPRTLYGGDLIGDAKRVFVTEGEQACDAGRLVGLACTTSSGGSSAPGQTDWSPLAGKEAVLLPDNDAAGEEYAKAVTRILHGLNPPATVKIVRLPDLPPKGDLADYVESRDSTESSDLKIYIDALANKAATACAPAGPTHVKAERRPVSFKRHIVGRCLHDVKPEKVSWLWPGRFPLGKLMSLLAGDPGLGKSFLTLDMCARLSRGTPWPDRRDEPIQPGNSIILSAEDGAADTLVPRLRDAEADLSKIFIIDEVCTDPRGRSKYFSLDGDLAALERYVEVHDAKLLVIDPVSAYLGSKRDEHKNGDVRGLLAPLSDLAERQRCSVIMVSHLNKGGSDRAAYRMMGSLAFVAAARVGWLVAKSTSDPRRRVLVPVKSNLIEEPQGIAFEIVDGKVHWFDDPIDEDCDCFLSESGVSRQESREIAEWLQGTLHHGEMGANEIQRAANAEGFSQRTLRRVKKSLGIVVRRQGYGRGGKFFWSLPNDAHIDGQTPVPPIWPPMADGVKNSDSSHRGPTVGVWGKSPEHEGAVPQSDKSDDVQEPTPSETCDDLTPGETLATGCIDAQWNGRQFVAPGSSEARSSDEMDGQTVPPDRDDDRWTVDPWA